MVLEVPWFAQFQHRDAETEGSHSEGSPLSSLECSLKRLSRCFSSIEIASNNTQGLPERLEVTAAEFDCERNTNMLLSLQYASELHKHKINSQYKISISFVDTFPYINFFH